MGQSLICLCKLCLWTVYTRIKLKKRKPYFSNHLYTFLAAIRSSDCGIKTVVKRFMIGVIALLNKWFQIYSTVVSLQFQVLPLLIQATCTSFLLISPCCTLYVLQTDFESHIILFSVSFSNRTESHSKILPQHIRGRSEGIILPHCTTKRVFPQQHKYNHIRLWEYDNDYSS